MPSVRGLQAGPFGHRSHARVPSRAHDGALKHRTTSAFWKHYRLLPESIQTLADRRFVLLSPIHAILTLRLKKVRNLVAVRVDSNYRAVGNLLPDGVLWFWIGSHE